MGPFDPIALVVMLNAFYPAVSAAAFARARRERPEYFAGGTIIGTGGDKLKLPDGRIFDCIFAVDGPPSGRRWQALDVTNGGDGPDDPFALEPGPLPFVDEDTPIFSGGDPSFESITAGGLDGLTGAAGVLDGAARDVVTIDSADRVERSYDADIVPALATHESIRGSLDEDNPIDVLNATNAQDPEIDQARVDYVEEPPADTPEPSPGEPPRDDDDGHDPPQR